MKDSFKRKLRQDIIKKFTWLALGLSVIIFVLLALFSFGIQRYQLDLETQRLKASYYDFINKSEQMIDELSPISSQLLLNDSSSGNITSMFTQMKKEMNYSAELILIDENKHIVYDSGITDSEQIIVRQHIQLGIDHDKVISEQRIMTNLKNNYYLITTKQVAMNNKKIGYMILMVNGNEFYPKDITFGTQYVVTDVFGNILSRNSDLFMKNNLFKANTDVLERKIFTYNGHLFLAKKIMLTDKFILYTYLVLVPLPVLLLTAFILALIVFILLISEAYRIAENVAMRNSQSIHQLVNETDLVMNQSKELITINSDDEFEYLGNSINKMLINIRNLHNQTLYLEQERVQFERKMLEAQFNPHFLYNTLETIKVTSQFDVAMTERVILLLNKVLRYSLGNVDELTTVKEDLQIIESYLEINKVRFDKLNYIINCDERLLDVKIPKLFLLPLIENSLKYGMQVRHDLMIGINITMINNSLLFEVKDNGKGFDDIVLRSINQFLAANATYHGMTNSYLRMKAYYASAQVIVNNNDSGGATITIVVDKGEIFDV